MWVRTQNNEIHKVDNIYSHIDLSISTVIDASLPVELGRYGSKEESIQVIDRLWDHLLNGGKTFQMPVRGFITK